ncbi:hypothetical protein ACFL3V_03570 [Nanoarchaeota archaeon]
MEIETVKRCAYWFTYFIFMLVLAVFVTAERITVLFRVILTLLLAILSSRFRFEYRYSFLSIVVVVLAGIWTGAVLSNNAGQFWAFAFLFVIAFFLSCEAFERRLLGV